MESLCRTCSNVRKVASGTGSTFLLCQLSQTDKRFSKYPPQPVIGCDGFEDEHDTLPGIVIQRDERLALIASMLLDEPANGVVTARIALLVAQPLEDPHRRMPLLLRL